MRIIRSREKISRNEHASSPIKSVSDLKDAADSAIGKIEGAVEQYIGQNPQTQITSQPLRDATRALSQSPRGQSFIDAGLKDLEDFHLDQPKTLAEADAIRKQLNAENKAVLKKNNYDIATARATTPDICCKRSSRRVIEEWNLRQIPGMRDARLDEGSLIKIRNAAQNQIFNGER